MSRIAGPMDIPSHTWTSPRQVAHFDAKAWAAPGRGLESIGKAISEVGAAISANPDGLSAEDKQAMEYAEKTRMLNFQQEQSDADRAAERNVPEDGRGYRNSVSQRYDGAAREYIKGTPAWLRPKIDHQLRQFAIDRDTKAREYEYNRQDQYYTNDINRSVEEEAGRISAESTPEDLNERYGRTTYKIDGSPLPTNRKMELRQGAYDILSARHIHLRNEAIQAKRAAVNEDGTPKFTPEEIATDEEALRRDIATFRSQYRDQVERETMSGRGQDGGKAQPGQSGGASGGQRPSDVKEFLHGRLAPGYEDRRSDVDQLHPVMQDRLGAFLAAAQDSGHDIRIVSGQRSAERQAVLWNKALEKYGSAAEARRYVAPPGGSTHQSGEAVDLQFGDRAAGLGGKKTEAVRWAHENASKFGLNFPLGHEDWHIEPAEARSGGRRFGGQYASDGQKYWKGGSVGGAAISTAGSGVSPESKQAASEVASQIGADPNAIGAVFSVESGKDWNPKEKTGQYTGVSQVGNDTLREMGMTRAQYDALGQAGQAKFYGKWLEHYNFTGKMKEAGIDFKSLPPTRQAAILQAFQFAPNGDWIKRLGRGDDKTAVTETKQARVLGSTSISDMEDYFSRNVPKGGGTAVAASRQGLTPNGKWRQATSDELASLSDSEKGRGAHVVIGTDGKESIRVGTPEEWANTDAETYQQPSYADNGHVKVASADDSVPQSARASMITAERFTPPKNESGIPQNPNREWYRLKGTPEEKATQLREILATGKQDVVHQLDSQGNDVVGVMASKNGKPSLAMNAVTHDEDGNTANALDKGDKFTGPGWAKDVVSDLKAGKIANEAQGVRMASDGTVTAGVNGDVKVAGIGDDGRVTTILAGMPKDMRLSQLPPDIMEQVRKLVPPGAFKDKTLSDGTKISAMDAFTVADAEAAFTAPLDAARREGGYGGRFIPRYADQPLYRMSPRAAEKAYNEIVRQQRASTSQMAEYEKQRIIRTGEEVRDAQGRTYLDRAKDILEPKAFMAAKAKVDEGRAIHKILAPLPTMSIDDLSAYGEQMQAAPGNTVQAAAYKTAKAWIDRRLKSFHTDAALAVEGEPEVRDVHAAIREGRQLLSMGMKDGQPQATSTPYFMSKEQAVEKLIEARIASQERLFGEKYEPGSKAGIGRFRMLTQGESNRLFSVNGNWKDLDEVEKIEAIKKAAKRADQWYGKYSKEAFESAAMMVIHANRNDRDTATGVLSAVSKEVAAKVASGERLSLSDLNSYRLAQDMSPSQIFAAGTGNLEPRSATQLPSRVPTAWPSASAIEGFNPRASGMAFPMPGPSPSMAAPQQQSGQRGGGMTTTTQMPDARDVQALLTAPRNSGASVAFDKKYGPGASQTVMEWWKTRGGAAGHANVGTAPASSGFLGDLNKVGIGY